ncbi:MAG TPA: hypothetical protein VIG99_05690 [Myxococcaceae bacterium]|jgi:hypothetical protein
MTTSRSALAPVVALVLAVEAVFVTSLALRRPEAQVPLQFGLAADCVLLAALAVWFAGRRAGGMGALGLTPSRMLKLAVMAVVPSLLVMRLAGIPLEGALAAVAAGVEVAIIGSVVIAVRQGASLAKAVEERLPPGVRQIAGGELRLLAAAVGPLFGRRRERPAGWFSTLERSGSGFIIPAALMLCAAELGAVHGFIALRWPHAWAAHAVLAGLTVYSMLWLVGDRRAMRETGHRIEGSNLVLELGLRFRAEVPLPRVCRVVRLRTDEERRRVQPKQGPRHLRVTPFDPANLHLCFREPVEARRSFGLKATVQHLDLYVDDPDAFAAALIAAAPDTSGNRA